MGWKNTELSCARTCVFNRQPCGLNTWDPRCEVGLSPLRRGLTAQVVRLAKTSRVEVDFRISPEQMSRLAVRGSSEPVKTTVVATVGHEQRRVGLGKKEK